MNLRPILLSILAGTVALAWCLPVLPAAEGEPLYLQEPFDQITLDEQNENVVMQVRPLDLPNRRLPENPDPKTKLKLQLLDRPDKLFEIEWQAVAKVELFEVRVLEEAKKFTEAGRLEEAYEAYRLLYEKYPRVRGLDRAYEDFLYAEAKDAHRQGRYDLALAMLRELRQLNPKRPELEKAIPLATEKLVTAAVAAENFPGARRMIRNLAAWFPQDPLVAKWEGQWKQQAEKSLLEARQALTAGRLTEADHAIRRVIQVWPTAAGAQELARAIHAKFPRVAVAVRTPSPADPDPARWDDWTARRSGRLVHRTLVEYVGPGNQGGRYESPLGELEVNLSQHRLGLRLKNDLHWSRGAAAVTGYDATRGLLAMAEAGQPGYRGDWAGTTSSVEVSHVYQIDVKLRRFHLRPEAWLQIRVLPPGDSAGVATGPYKVDSQQPAATIYTVNSSYNLGGPTRPQQLVERHLSDADQAIAALLAGEVQAIDRLAPAEVARLRAARQVKVESYALPWVHCLIPNARRPLPASRTFRRAALYALDREAILRRLAGASAVPGCAVLSAPWLSEEPAGYGYDTSIKPRPYQPATAVALVGLALAESQTAAKETTARPAASIVLAHSSQGLVRTAAAAIAQQWGLVGINVTLKELGPEATLRCPDDADFLYAELAAWEPALDARRVLGRDGLCQTATPAMEAALRQVDESADWTQIRGALRQVHRLAHEETAVIPLWQLNTFCAYHESLQGIGSRPLTLYQNVERWQAAFHYPAEEK